MVVQMISLTKDSLTTFANTKELVENTTCSKVLLVNFVVLGNEVKQCPELYISFQSKLKVR